MKLKVKTSMFQDMVARASKGASENKLLPLTSFMAVSLKQNVLTLITTDTSNTLKIVADKVEGEDFYAVVPVDVFSKLVAKTTSETITLTLKENSLEVKGNGVYNISLPQDEEGLIELPEPDSCFGADEKPADKLHLTTIKNILNINKAAVSKSIDTPVLCSYYLGESVITTDENVICFNLMPTVKEPKLISSDTMELLALSNSEDIDVYVDGPKLLFVSADLRLFSYEHDGKEVFPVDDITAYLDEEFKSMCKVPKTVFQNVIDRLSLFIEPYDKNGAYLTFTPDGIKVTSKKSSSVEVLSYTESKAFSPFVCCVDIPMLKAQIDVIPGETVEVHYGHDSALKLKTEKVIQIIALLEDDSLPAGSTVE